MIQLVQNVEGRYVGELNIMGTLRMQELKKNGDPVCARVNWLGRISLARKKNIMGTLHCKG